MTSGTRRGGRRRTVSTLIEAATWEDFARRARRDARVWFMLTPDRLLTLTRGEGQALPVWSSRDSAEQALALSDGADRLDVCCVTVQEWNRRWLPSLREKVIGVGADWPTLRAGEARAPLPI
ncbi:DUF2750 domain-containing protein [Leifsonia sp. RAF41]|uniref:DUF2750 domain-containing protein n=1 Tax=Leifsonia sp. RAF41 TaxID=3233056 RepID=UPI003F9BCF9F